MSRSEQFLRTRDIDWALKVGNLYIHASSAGDNLPDIVDENLSSIWKTLKSATVFYTSDQIQLNDSYLNTLFPPQKLAESDDLRLRKEWYVHSFRAMATRGFYSFDRDISTPIGESTYHLIASPGADVRNMQLKLPHVTSNMTIDEFATCNLVQVINRLSRIE